MVRKIVKSKAKIRSIDRIVRQFKGMELNKISEIQLHYINKNPQGIRDVLNKSNLKDSSAMGQGRLCNQYATMLSEPTYKAKRRIMKIYKIDLEPKNYAYNLIRMGNTQRVVGGGVGDTPEDDFRIPEIGDIPITGLDEILSLRGLGIVQKDKKGYETIVKGTKNNILDYLNRMNLTTKEIQLLHLGGIYQFRALIKILYENGEEGWVSSSNSQLQEYDKIENLFDDTRSYIVDSKPYWDGDNEEYVIFERILEMRVYWMN